MNERIRELAKQAVRGIQIDFYIPDVFKEKFAELIVQECMELGDKALQDGKWPGDVLEKHFGLK